MKNSQNIQRLGHTKFTSCSSDFVLKTLDRASDLEMLIKSPKETYCFCSVSYYYSLCPFFPQTMNLFTADLRNYWTEFHET